MVGNKSDLNHLRSVSSNEGQEFSEKNKIQFKETSALDATNVEETFQTLIEEIYKAQGSNTSSSKRDDHGSTVVITKPGATSSGCGC